MSRGIIILIVLAVVVVGALIALASIDTHVAPHEVQKDVAAGAAPAR